MNKSTDRLEVRIILLAACQASNLYNPDLPANVKTAARTGKQSTKKRRTKASHGLGLSVAFGPQPV